MSKIHTKTGSVCLICDEQLDNSSIFFHKTRRQTHSLCGDCGVGYLKPVLKMISENLRKNIKKGCGIVKCPGSYHGQARNLCKSNINIDSIILPKNCELSTDFFRISYALSCDTAYLCPEEKCGHVIDVDPDYNDYMLHCVCKTTWCRQCLHSPFHEGKSCLEFESENKNTENGKLIWELHNKGVLKFCPCCRTPILKNDGCNKIYCIKCGVKWCWICMKTDIDYSHYNSSMSGSCSGKLWEGVEDLDIPPPPRLFPFPHPHPVNNQLLNIPPPV